MPGQLNIFCTMKVVKKNKKSLGYICLFEIHVQTKIGSKTCSIRLLSPLEPYEFGIRLIIINREFNLRFEASKQKNIIKIESQAPCKFSYLKSHIVAKMLEEVFNAPL